VGFGDRPWVGAALPNRHPFAGGEGHYAAFFENAERFKVELVAEA
jgi:hypothetical protein